MGMECHFDLNGHCEFEIQGANGCTRKEECRAAFDTQPKMSLERAKEIVAQVSFRDYQFNVYDDQGKRYLQAAFPTIDSYGGGVDMQTTRKWLLSPYMTKSEVVQTCFKLVLTAIEHEAREDFRYKDARVFGPHFDVEALVELCKDKRVDYRKN